MNAQTSLFWAPIETDAMEATQFLNAELLSCQSYWLPVLAIFATSRVPPRRSVNLEALVPSPSCGRKPSIAQLSHFDSSVIIEGRLTDIWLANLQTFLVGASHRIDGHPCICCQREFLVRVALVLYVSKVVKENDPFNRTGAIIRSKSSLVASIN